LAKRKGDTWPNWGKIKEEDTNTNRVGGKKKCGGFRGGGLQPDCVIGEKEGDQKTGNIDHPVKGAGKAKGHEHNGGTGRRVGENIGGCWMNGAGQDLKEKNHQLWKIGIKTPGGKAIQGPVVGEKLKWVSLGGEGTKRGKAWGRGEWDQVRCKKDEEKWKRMHNQKLPINRVNGKWEGGGGIA